jgi:hypothetical protein
MEEILSTTIEAVLSCPVFCQNSVRADLTVFPLR